MSSPAALALGRQLREADGGAVDRGRRPSAGIWAWGGGLAAAAALLLVLFSGSGPAGDGAVDAKGRLSPETTGLLPKGAAQLALWVGDGDEADAPLDEPRVLHAGDRVQPVFAPPGKGFVALLLTTPEGKVIRLHPADESRAALVETSAPAPLGPSFRLDEEVGVYQVTAFFAEKVFSTAELLDRSASARKSSFPGVVLVERFEVRRSW